jgi:hypothetical protein
MFCPCCGQPLDDIHRLIDYALRGPVERRMAHFLARNRGEWLSGKQIVDFVYEVCWDGGPADARGVVDQTFIEIRNKLLPFGVKFESEGHGHGRGRRMLPPTGD